MISYLIGVVGSLVGLIGWFGFHSLPALIVGTVFYVIETIIEWNRLNVGAKILDFVIFGVGSIVSLRYCYPFYIGGMIAVLIYAGITAIISIIIPIICLIFSKKE